MQNMNANAAETLEMSNRDRITIEQMGDWREVVPIQRLPNGVKGLGIVRRGDEPWGVLAQESDGEYVRISREGLTHPLDQRKVRAALELPPPEGKPRMGDEVRQPYTVRLEPTLAEYATVLGDGSLAEGLIKLIRSHRSRSLRKTLVIEFPREAVKIIHTVGVQFQAIVNGETRDCTVSAEALRDHFGAGSVHARDLQTAFISGKDDIHKAAKRLLAESSEDIVIGTKDIF